MRYIVGCRHCSKRWVDGDDLATSDHCPPCQCPQPLRRWDVTRAPTPGEASQRLHAARRLFDACEVPGGCPACQLTVLAAITTAGLAVHAYTGS